MEAHTCSCCGSREIRPLLDFGLQPVCNRFLHTPDESEALFPVGISLCEQCGLIFLTRNIPVEELRPRFDWISYKEAEAHLDDVVAHIIAASAAATGNTAFGISGHDVSTLDRLARKTFGRVGSLDLGAGIETIQSLIRPEWADSWLQTHAPVDFIMARYILEHAHDVGAFLSAMRRLVKPGGLVAFEVPDFSVALANCDYSNIWEEHTFYFTPTTLRSMLGHHGFAVREILSYPYPLENSLIAICQPSGATASNPPAGHEIAVAKNYAEQFPLRREQTRAALERLSQSGKIAVFGAGHLAMKFINFLGLAKSIAFVADDHPKKRGLYMPGSHLPIKPSAALAEEGIRWCLLSLNPESEERVLKNLKHVFENGGIKIYSIFQASPKRLPLDP
ncbi:MAG TPA: class I SAM-dependent methyltransferase [Chthoniobacteraceae bacterium]|nr:class I SAM-dependent methyltransferase [Chthoniobacteraceae bacterium]